MNHALGMPRTGRRTSGGVIFHVLNRGVGRRVLFHKDEDYAAFERVLEAVRLSGPQGPPVRADPWRSRITRQLGLESSFRRVGLLPGAEKTVIASEAILKLTMRQLAVILLFGQTNRALSTPSNR